MDATAAAARVLELERVDSLRLGLELDAVDYQYTEYYDEAGEIVFREYYDLVHDRWQLVNLLHDGRPGNDPDVGPLHDRLTADRSCVGTACP